jgi:DNA-binding MarR family transcriptional regulator
MSKRRLTLDAFLPYRLSFTANLVSGAIADAYQSLFALGIPEWRVIAHIAEREGITQQEIRHRTRMDKVAISRATRELERRGLVGRKPNPADQRSQLLVLTDAGDTLYGAIAPKALALEQEIFGDFTKDEIATLTALLRRIDRRVLGEGTATD